MNDSGRRRSNRSGMKRTKEGRRVKRRTGTVERERERERKGEGDREKRETKREREREGKGSQEVEVDDLSILHSLHPMAMKEP